MAISKEDKHDVQRAYGKALANKVAKVTNDRKHTFAGTGSRKWTDQEAKGISQLVRSRGEKDIKNGNYRKLSVKSVETPYKSNRFSTSKTTKRGETRFGMSNN